MDFLSAVFNAGVVGCGGAGFPAHIKLNSRVEELVINAAECEPLLRTDRYLLLHNAQKLVEAAGITAAHLGAKRIYFALKKAYTEETECLRKEIEISRSGAELFLLDNYYPAGDEQMLVLEVTGKTVPAGGIPPDAGAVVSNAATMLCIHDAIHGRPFTHRVLTVTGEVNNPVIVRAPLGTPVSECIDLAGGAVPDGYAVIVGGPLMGRVLYERREIETEVITKTTSGLIVLNQDAYLAAQSRVTVESMINRVRSACIRCSYCTEQCPRYLAGHPLQPHRIMRKLAYSGSVSSIIDDDDVKQALICCECGVCTWYACPMQLSPGRINGVLKREYAKAGIKYGKGCVCVPRPERAYRKIPSKRIASRVGVLKYYEHVIDTLVECIPDKVEIPVVQHIGVPSEPVVSPGDRVKCGQLIAKCPQDKPGANIHAGIDGIVTAAGRRIAVERR